MGLFGKLGDDIIDWEKLRQGASLEHSKIERIFSFISPKNLEKEKQVNYLQVKKIEFLWQKH